MDSMEFINNHGMQRSNSNSSSDISSMSRRSRLLTCFKPTATLDDDDMLLSPGGETRRRKSKWQALRKAIKETSLVRTLSNKRKERKERKLRSNSSSSSMSSMSSLSNMSSNDNSSSISSISTSSSSSPSLNSFSPIQDNNNSKVLTPTLTIKNMRLHNLRTTSLPSNPSNNSSPLLTTSASISSTSSFSSRLGSIFSPHHHTTSPKSPFSPQSVSNRTPFSPQNHPRTPKQGQIYINYKREGCSYDAYTATYMLLVSLLFLVMWGKTLAIFYTSIWFYVVRPARRRPEINNCQYGRNKSGDYNQLIGLMQYRRKMLKQGSLIQRSDTNLLSMSSSCSMPTHLSSTFNSMRRNSFSGKISC
ncbi:hypothetical protein HN51_019842 [Arachis hypogaea]|uniref:uncharacterized protein n=1 Tax=Arachis hypogaea TaxID=3818 RepID=UPI003B20E159